MEVITRKEAIAKGLKTYFIRKPCPKGHVSVRYISGVCRDCHRAIYRRPQHLEKARQRGRKWYSDPANRERRRVKVAQPEHKERKRLRERKRLENPEVRRRAKDKRRERGRREAGLPCPTRPDPDFCEICGHLSVKSLAIDHCHKSGKFRGWLCLNCNMGLGFFKDAPERLRRAAEYLEKNG